MMSKAKGTNFEKFEAQLLASNEVRKEYEALKPKYDLISSLIEHRNKLNLSQTALAKMIGTRQPAISRLERGDYNTTLSMLFKVATALGLKLDISLKPNGRKKRSRQKVTT